MRAVSFIFIFMLCERLNAQVPDYIYQADEYLNKGNILEISLKRIKYKNEFGEVRSRNLEEVLMVFNRTGDYLIFPDKQLTKNRIAEFVNPVFSYKSDLLITLEKKIIPAKVIAVTDNYVLYEHSEKSAGEQSIAKDMLAVIIYKDGRHHLLVSPSQASMVLAKVNGQKPQYRKKGLQTRPEEKKTQSPVKEIKLSDSSINARKKNPPPPPEQKRVSERSGRDSEKKKDTKNVSEVNLALYNKRAIQKVNELKKYISLIANKNTGTVEAEQAIENACRLFLHEDAKAEVASATTYKIKYKVKDFFYKIRASKNSEVELLWVNVNYVVDCEKQENEVYTGKIYASQNIQALNQKDAIFDTLVKKEQTTALPGFRNGKPGAKETWEVFLSAIGIAITTSK
jgi:hypothetical protein